MKSRFKLLLLFCTIVFTSRAQQDHPLLFNLGDPAPPLRVGEWLKGTPIQNFEKGRVYVIEFWATWCRGCMAAMPHLSALARTHKHKITVIAIDAYESGGEKNRSTGQVKALVDSMGRRMNFDVATADTNFTIYDWIDAWGQKGKGIPRTFVVNAQGKVAWIGYPYDLHEVLPKILNNTWNVKEARETAISQWSLDHYLDSLDAEAAQKLFKYNGAYNTKDDLGDPDSALLVINELVSKEPKLKYATLTANFTFTALLKTNPHKAYEYGKEVIMTDYEGSPSYQAIIGGIKDYVYKLKLSAEIYQLGTEAYAAEIKQNPYPELFDPEIYNTLANWYWMAGNKSKAMKARRKFKKLSTRFTTVRWDYLQ